MAIALVQQKPAVGNIPSEQLGGTTLEITFDSNVTAGNLITLCFGEVQSNFTVADTQNCTWYQDKSLQNPELSEMYLSSYHCYAKNSASMKITITSSYAAIIGCAQEWSGVTSGLTAGASGSNSSHHGVNSDTLDTGYDGASGNCLHLAAGFFGGIVPPSILDGNFTLLNKDDSFYDTTSAGSWNLSVAYRIASGSQHCVWTFDETTPTIGTIVAFAQTTPNPTGPFPTFRPDLT